MKRVKTAAVGAVVVLGVTALAACSPAKDDKAAVKGSNVATGDTITIGAMTPSEGAGAFIENEYGLLAGVWYVNNELGGINGRKLEVDLCKGNGSPETAVACANGFVGKKYPVVIDGYDFSFGGARPILVEAGIPFVGAIAGDPTNEKAEYGQGFYWTGPLATTAAGMANVWEQNEVESVHLALSDTPQTHAYIDSTFKPMAEALGVEADVQYVDPAKANWDAVAAAELKTKPDQAGSISLPEDGCTGLFDALRKQGWTDQIFVGSCTKYVEELDPTASANTVTIPRTWLYQAKDHAPSEVVEQLEDFKTAMDAVGHGDSLEARAIYAFNSVVTLAQILNDQKVEDLTPESIVTAIESAKDFPSFLGPKITCDGQQWPATPTSCSNESIYFEVQEDGSYKP
ncbi:MAG: ABC transporter substrate-binding protein, partial [Nocardioidaceae bacterium]